MRAAGAAELDRPGRRMALAFEGGPCGAAGWLTEPRSETGRPPRGLVWDGYGFAWRAARLAEFRAATAQAGAEQRKQTACGAHGTFRPGSAYGAPCAGCWSQSADPGRRGTERGRRPGRGWGAFRLSHAAPRVAALRSGARTRSRAGCERPWRELLAWAAAICSRSSKDMGTRNGERNISDVPALPRACIWGNCGV